MRRVRPRASKVLLVASLLLATAATLVLRGHLARLEARAAAGVAGAEVLVAARGLARGEVIDPAAVRVRRVPERYAPPGALRRPEEATGLALGSPLAAGEPLTATRLAPRGGPVAALVPPGLRAVPLATALPPGIVVQGDRVDVLATYAGGQPHTETVATDVEVLRVLEGETIEGLGPVTVVVVVGPEDAERLAYARSFAELSLSIVPAEAAG